MVNSSSINLNLRSQRNRSFAQPMTKPAHLSSAFLKRLSVELTVSQLRSLSYVPALLIHYSFDLLGYPIEECLDRWMQQYRVNWLRLAIVEALYQGRYKGISIEQILALWQRRGQPICHFNHEFEQIVCSKLPEELLPFEAIVEAMETQLSLQQNGRPRLLEPVLEPESEPSLVPETEDKPTETDSDASSADSPSTPAPDDEQPSTPPPDLATPPESDEPKPLSALELLQSRLPDSPTQVQRSETQPPIDRFSPPLPASEFHLKLRSLAAEQETNESRSSPDN
ncbi:hypothetical protein [Roseofilum casamattae]|uniref:Uncharacterized protein n=1 Tax=Roseofilum casamattae BLCC-M143 TaxID=3022442 RepID=A0ABT7BZ89_9CYAN|nr:hypothetical protein [Roseofilum casamattae]MDJ1184524.1 hypothetical protein [Roseofilum casamattae BLCC-M143]